MAVTGNTGCWNERQRQAEELPALTNKTVQEHGWQRQAEHLSIAHVAVGVAAIAATGQPRRRPPLQRRTSNFQTAEEKLKRGLISIAHRETSPAQTVSKNSAEPYGTQNSPTDQQILRDKAAPPPRTSLERLVDEIARASALPIDSGVANEDPRPPELRAELGWVQEERIHWENENCSLQVSLDLLVSENSRLSHCLTQTATAGSHRRIAELEDELVATRQRLVFGENAHRSLRASLALAEKARSELERKKTAVTAADAKLGRSAIAFNGPNEKSQAENGALHTRHQDLSISAAAAEKRIAELESELGTMRRRLALREDENRSLQASLAGAGEMRSQLERKEADLIAADAELRKLAFAFNETNEERRTEINTLHTRLQTVSARAAIAERLLAEAQENWLVQIQEYSSAERRAADASAACEAANLKLESLENSLRVKERQLLELVQSSSKLIGDALKSFDTLDTAPACDQRMQFLTRRVGQRETEMNDRAEARHALDDRVGQDAGNSAPIEFCSTEALLASTISL